MHDSCSQKAKMIPQEPHRHVGQGPGCLGFISAALSGNCVGSGKALSKPLDLPPPWHHWWQKNSARRYERSRSAPSVDVLGLQCRSRGPPGCQAKSRFSQGEATRLRLAWAMQLRPRTAFPTLR